MAAVSKYGASAMDMAAQSSVSFFGHMDKKKSRGMTAVPFLTGFRVSRILQKKALRSRESVLVPT